MLPYKFEDLIRVCAWCKRETDKQNEPQQLANPETPATHGMCNACDAKQEAEFQASLGESK